MNSKIKIVYRLTSNKNEEELPEKIIDFIYDIDEDFTTKEEYIEFAKKITKKVNDKFDTGFEYTELFGIPRDTGYRYCTKCRTHFWLGDNCCCRKSR